MGTATEEATRAVATANGALAMSLPFGDEADQQAVQRGLIGTRQPGAVTNQAGEVVWDNDTYAFLRDECPPTVNPSLWRQSGLVASQGLYEVTTGLYQVRGMDLGGIALEDQLASGAITVKGDPVDHGDPGRLPRRARPQLRNRHAVARGKELPCPTIRSSLPTRTTRP